ncbi:cation:dicarboxylase symporter family transporter [Arthrobacter sp. SIMBA_036]|uniref:cation:dicarboxylate symporter family transporter n=1 Tax=Arthrobacter sp. SIMBA_036 TaxID=3085778 RepID=UPI00397C844B
MSSHTMQNPQHSAPPKQRSRFGQLLRELWFQVLLGGVLGILVGFLLPSVGQQLTPLSDWFIALVKMIIILVVFCVVTLGVASMDSLPKAGRIGIKALGYFIVLSLISMLIGLVVANVFHPGDGMNIDVSKLNGDKIPGAGKSFDGLEFVTSLIPTSFFGALTGSAIPAALLVSIVFGAALNLSGESGAVLTSGIRALSTVVFRIVGWLMRLAPFGTFGALAAVVAKYGFISLQQLGYLILLFTLTCIVYVLVVLGIIAKSCGLNIFTVMRYFKDELLIALATCSSEAVLPQVMKKLENMGVGKPTVGIVIPSAFSFNLDGSAIYLTMASVFLAQAVGIHLSREQQLAMVGIMMISSKGTAGVTGGAFIVLAGSLGAVSGIPTAALALIVGVDRLLNEGRVFINVIGNVLAAVVIGKWERDFDPEQARKTLHASGQKKPAIESKTPASVEADKVEVH